MDAITKKQLSILIQLAEADKHFARSEREVIFRIAREQNVSEKEVLELIRHPEPIGSLRTLTENQKFDYIMSAIELIFADHNIFETELVFCKSLAIKLGFKKSVIDYLLGHYEKITREQLKSVVFSEYACT